MTELSEQPWGGCPSPCPHCDQEALGIPCMCVMCAVIGRDMPLEDWQRFIKFMEGAAPGEQSAR